MMRCKLCGKVLTNDRYDICNDCHQSTESFRKRLNDGYLRDGYFDSKGNIRREIIIDFPQQMAYLLSSNRMGSAALRRFFTRIKAIERHAEQSPDFDRIKPELYNLQSAVRYSRGRNIVPKEFVQFIDSNVELASQGQEHLKAFIKHFESVIAFFKYQNPNN